MVKPLTGRQCNQVIELLHDAVFNKRHLKHEMDEKRRKRYSFSITCCICYIRRWFDLLFSYSSFFVVGICSESVNSDSTRSCELVTKARIDHKIECDRKLFLTAVCQAPRRLLTNSLVLELLVLSPACGPARKMSPTFKSNLGFPSPSSGHLCPTSLARKLRLIILP